MIVQPRGALVVAAAVAFGLAWAPWWDLSWTDALGVQTLAVTGAQGTGGMAQILPVAALGGILATLTLRCVGRRVIAVVLGGLFVSMAALGFDARNPDPARLAATESAAALATSPEAAPTLIPVAYLVAGIVGVAASVWFGWKPGDRRSERTTSPSGVEDTVSPWKAMDAGHDPTLDGWDGERP